MKNISRRVFIKGLAVAGVAAAASTVLAGCNTNMIPGVDEGEGGAEEVPSTSGALEFTDKTDSKINAKISALSMVLGAAPYDSDGNAAIKLQIVNNLGKDLYFVSADPTTYASTGIAASATKVADGDYYVLVEAYIDDIKAATTAFDATTTTDNLLYKTSGAPKAVAKDKTTVDYIRLNDVTDSESVALKLTLKKAVGQTNGYFETLAEQTYTFKV